jgi:hypothetical protein
MSVEIRRGNRSFVGEMAVICGVGLPVTVVLCRYHPLPEPADTDLS